MVETLWQPSRSVEPVERLDGTRDEGAGVGGGGANEVSGERRERTTSDNALAVASLKGRLAGSERGSDMRRLAFIRRYRSGQCITSSGRNSAKAKDARATARE